MCSVFAWYFPTPSSPLRVSIIHACRHADARKQNLAHVSPSLPSTFDYYSLFRKRCKYQRHDRQQTLKQVTLHVRLSPAHIAHALLILRCYQYLYSLVLLAQIHKVNGQIVMHQSTNLARFYRKHLTAKLHQIHHVIKQQLYSLQ